jgi:hypothetical protein
VANQIRGQGFAARVRESAAMLGARGEPFSSNQLVERLGMAQCEKRAALHLVFLDMRRRGELQNVGGGIYRYLGAESPTQKQEVMWQLLRFKKMLTVEDLQELSGACRKYCEEFLCHLVGSGVLKRYDNGDHKLLKDSEDMPPFREKAERLRLLRSKKRDHKQQPKSEPNETARSNHE